MEVNREASILTVLLWEALGRTLPQLVTVLELKRDQGTADEFDLDTLLYVIELTNKGKQP